MTICLINYVKQAVDLRSDMDFNNITTKSGVLINSHLIDLF